MVYDVCEREVWHKRDDESDVAYNYFGLFLELGPSRRLTRMGDAYGSRVPSLSRLNKLSSDYDWVARAHAYDDYRVEERRRRYEGRLDEVLEHEFGELEEAFETSHALRKRIEADDGSSIYSLLNAWRNWVEAHNKITDEMYMIAGKPKEAPRRSEIQALEQTQTKKVTDSEKIEEVTRALKLVRD